MRIIHAACASVLALGAALVGPGAEAQQSFDGRWSVEVITEQGTCDRAYRYPVAISGGQVSYAGPEAFDVSGRVAANGRVQGSIERGQARVNVTGQLQGASGSGTWIGSGGVSCSGRWNAERRG